MARRCGQRGEFSRGRCERWCRPVARKSRRSPPDARTSAFRARGFATLLVDLSAHGESQGDRISLGTQEALDARACVAFARDRLPGKAVVGVGFSLGGAAFALASADLDVDALVLEAVFPDLETAVRRRIVPHSGAINHAVSGWVVRRLRWRLDVDETALCPVDELRHAQCPVLIIVGERDSLAPPEDGERLRAAVPAGQAELWVVPDAAHTDYHTAAPVEYEARVGVFLERVLEKPE